jgi:hypothetical protein
MTALDLSRLLQRLDHVPENGAVFTAQREGAGEFPLAHLSWRLADKIQQLLTGGQRNVLWWLAH